MGVLRNLKKRTWSVVPAGWREWVHRRIHRETRDLWVFPSIHEQMASPESSASVRFSFADEKTLHEILADRDLGVSAPSIPYYTALLRDGNRLVVGRDEDRIVFYGGVMCGRRMLPRGFFLLEDDEFCIVACFTRADCRGRGIYPSALRYVCGRLGQEGFRRGYIDVATYNTASVNGIAKAGGMRTDSGYEQIHFLGCDMSLPRGPLRARFVNTACPFFSWLSRSVNHAC